MGCNQCKTHPVIELQSGNKSCKNCFIKYFEKKVRRTIGEYDLIKSKERIAVAVSGGKDSLTVLSILNSMASQRRNIEIFAILIDEGIKDYREKTVKDAKEFCKKNKIKLHIFSYKKEFGADLDTIIKKSKINGCSVCGVMRRYMLNHAARKLKATKLATGHNMDDEAQSVMMNYMKNNLQISARMGPITGIKEDEQFVKRIKPLYFMTEKEVTAYSFLKGLLSSYQECPYAKQSYRNDVRDMINEFEKIHPGTKYSIIASFMELLPLLRERYKNEQGRISHCPKCDEPTSGIICQYCKMVDEIKLKLK